MSNFYQQFKLSPKASSKSLVFKLERRLRKTQLSKEEKMEALEALSILSHEKLREVYDRQLKNLKIPARWEAFLASRTSNLRAKYPDYHFEHLYSEKEFWKLYGFRMVLRCLGLDFLIFGVGDRNETRSIYNDGGVMAIVIYFLYTYSIPVGLSIYKLQFVWTILLVFTYQLWKEYRQTKLDHYVKVLDPKTY